MKAVTAPAENDRRNIFLLGLISFINDTASKIILPILPLFIKELGGAGLALGLITGLSDSVASLLKMIAGIWSDRSGKRKPFVFWGYLLSSLAKLLFALAASWQHVLLLRTAERFGKGLRAAPRDALLAASTVTHRRGMGFGIHRAMDSAGAVLGTLIAFALFWYLDFGFTQIFLVAGIISFISLTPLLFVHDHNHQPPAITATIGLRRLPSSLKLFMTIAFVYALGNFSYMFFVLRSEAAFTGKLSIAIPILLFALYNLAFTLFAIPAGALSDKIGRRRVLLLGYGLFVLINLGFTQTASLGGYVILFILLGLNYALVEANERAYVADLADPSLRGTALGTYHMITSLAALPAGLIAGLLWDLDPIITFIYGASLSGTAVILLVWQSAWRKHPAH